MKQSTRENMITRKKRASEAGTLVGTRIQANLLEKIDEWCASRRPIPTRPEALRTLAERGLDAETYVELLDKSMKVIGGLLDEAHLDDARLRVRIIEILGTYKSKSQNYKK